MTDNGRQFVAAEFQHYLIEPDSGQCSDDTEDSSGEEFPCSKEIRRVARKQQQKLQLR